MDKQVFAIVGLGPAGGIMATYLTRAGHEVVIVDILKDHLDEIRDNGLVITGFQELTARFVLENICYSIDGLRGKKSFLAKIPKKLYKRHLLLHSGNASFSKVQNKQIEPVHESLYLNY